MPYTVQYNLDIQVHTCIVNSTQIKKLNLRVLIINILHTQLYNLRSYNDVLVVLSR